MRKTVVGNIVHQPVRLLSCIRRTETENVGMIIPRPNRILITTITPMPMLMLLRPIKLNCTAVSAALASTRKSTHSQYSLRRARPSNSKYFASGWNINDRPDWDIGRGSLFGPGLRGA